MLKIAWKEEREKNRIENVVFCIWKAHALLLHAKI
jgi:hypothetical protein